ncbi:hypothetical protein [Morganella morganii]|uniref:hypothetical protein n=1 Tax=Morganella morganii TaxID=582 RepID=UPI001FFD3015|nr:hypothetical protein [Morganella morganii]
MGKGIGFILIDKQLTALFYGDTVICCQFIQRDIGIAQFKTAFLNIQFFKAADFAAVL